MIIPDIKNTKLNGLNATFVKVLNFDKGLTI
ncbi:hypothetical protein MCETHM1_00033 [Flavobacteriaceae bacterium]|jgi:hypothetical protein